MNHRPLVSFALAATDSIFCCAALCSGGETSFGGRPTGSATCRGLNASRGLRAHGFRFGHPVFLSILRMQNKCERAWVFSKDKMGTAFQSFANTVSVGCRICQVLGARTCFTASAGPTAYRWGAIWGICGEIWVRLYFKSMRWIFLEIPPPGTTYQDFFLGCWAAWAVCLPLCFVRVFAFRDAAARGSWLLSLWPSQYGVWQEGQSHCAGSDCGKRGRRQ